MIPLAKRSVRRFETTLVSYSRQSLPRPYRLYSTPSKTTHAPALATATAPPTEAPPYLPPSLEKELSMAIQMTGFLHRDKNYTILPTPAPGDVETNKVLFQDTIVQNTISIIEACTYNLNDVSRARAVFERFRKTHRGDRSLHSGLYNLLLDAYIQMAVEKEPEKRSYWVEDAAALYEVMESGIDKITPTANTYAIMLRAWLLFNPNSQRLVASTVDMPTPIMLLRAMIDRQIPASLVVSDRAIRSTSEASEIIKLLSKAAVEMNLSKVVNELGMAESLGKQTPDPLDDVPEAMPVMKPKKPELRAVHAEDGSVTEIEVPPDAQAQPELEVPFNLANLRKHLAQVILARRVLPEDVAARQKLLEESVYDVAVERLKHQAELFEVIGLKGTGLGGTDLRKWMWDWHQKFRVRLKAEIDALVAEEQKLGVDRQAGRLSPFLTLLKPDKLSLITILELMSLQSSESTKSGMKIARALLAVGKAVEIEYKAEMCKKNNISFPANPARGGEHGYFSSLGYRDLHARRVAAARYMEDAEEWTSDWSQVVRVKVGAFLVDLLMDVATVMRTAIDKRTGENVSEEQPAFVHSYEYQRGHRLGIIRLNELVAQRIARDTVRETLHPRHLPMLVKPKPWLGHDEGGYLYNKTSVMRYKDSAEQQIYLRQASNLGNVELVYAALDVLGTTPWQINRDIFDVVLKVWNSGKRFHKIPPSAFDLQEPEKPENYEFDPKAKSVYIQRMKAYQNSRANNHSERCNVNYKVEIARTFLGDTFYLPHNIDFRGRAYPIPPHLNHVGDDLSRGLLKFAEKKRLGERGLRWLKIHLSNLFGYDKASFDDRVLFVDKHLEDIYDSAENPLEGKRWWTKADDAWQCLAACMELRNALESGDPYNFESNLPVHQDGTCNGLQHYAALGGDDRGAQQVNLDVTDKPSDVYTYVANMVEAQIARDVDRGEYYAKMLQGKIARKVVKQTVMTTVYGVTFVGARDQIEKQLKDRGEIPIEECWSAASYLAKVTLNCIGDLFSSAKQIQNWLNLCARLISKSIPPDRLFEVTKSANAKKGAGRAVVPFAARVKKEQMSSVIWTTPLGLPIVQPYRQEKKKQIITAMQTVFISDPNSPATVNSQKQASAFPPNFVHSLDATHMMLTALECRTRNITFASVHDSYWTHAAAVDEMSVIIRETFIGLHSSNVLQRLYDEFCERYKGYKVPIDSIQTLLYKLPKPSKIIEVMEDHQALTLDEKATEILSRQFKSLPAEEDEEEEETIGLDADEDDEFGGLLGEGLEAEVGEEGVVAKTKPKKKRAKRTKADGPQPTLVNKFVDMTELLPPIPEKGIFNVDRVMNSLYFFS